MRSCTKTEWKRKCTCCENTTEAAETMIWEGEWKSITWWENRTTLIGSVEIEETNEWTKVTNKMKIVYVSKRYLLCNWGGHWYKNGHRILG